MERKRFTENRHGIVRKVAVGGAEFYITVNKLPNGTAGEVFVKIAKCGSTVSGLMQALVTTLSIALQHGVPWEVLRSKYAGMRFEPRDDKYESLVDALAKVIDEIVALPAPANEVRSTL